jgi:hypothetical protein
LATEVSNDTYVLVEVAANSGLPTEGILSHSDEVHVSIREAPENFRLGVLVLAHCGYGKQRRKEQKQSDFPHIM